MTISYEIKLTKGQAGCDFVPEPYFVEVTEIDGWKWKYFTFTIEEARSWINRQSV